MHGRLMVSLSQVSSARGLAKLDTHTNERPPPAEPRLPAETEPGWAGRFILGHRGACPSVPRKNGALDVQGVDRLLGRIKSLAPGCRRTIVGATDDTLWHEVATMLALVITEHGSDAAVLAAGGLLPPEPNCSEAIPIDEVSPVP